MNETFARCGHATTHHLNSRSNVPTKRAFGITDAFQNAAGPAAGAVRRDPFLEELVVV